MHESLPELCQSAELDFTYLPDIPPERVAEELNKGYDGLVLRSKLKVTESFLSQLKGGLKFVGRAGAGVDNVDVQALAQRGIHLIHTPEGNRDAVAEHTLGMLLSLLNRIHLADREVRQKVWRREANRGLEVKGKVVGIIGFGNTGQAFAKRLQGFDCEVIAYDRAQDEQKHPLARLCTLRELQERSDIISLHIPLDEKNYHWANETFLNAFKKPFFLLNASRGAVLDLSALCRALASGKVRGAALDVLENERLSTLSAEEEKWFDYLKNSERVLLTPHVAGWTQESYQRINEVMVEKIVAWQETMLTVASAHDD